MRPEFHKSLNTVGDWLAFGLKELQNLGSDEAKASMETFLAELLRVSRSHIYIDLSRGLDENQQVLLQTQIEQRKARVPTAYILGKTFFWKECLEVGPGCLVPRPETEILVEKIIELCFPDASQALFFIDIGSGSGAITVALLRHFLNANAVAADISEAALVYTAKNLERYKLLERSRILCTDLFPKNFSTKQYDLIVSNPPYLSEDDWKCAEPELSYEPKEALLGGVSGLEFYERLISEAGSYLVKGGWLALELGMGQAPSVAAMLVNSGFESIQTIRDYQAIERIVLAKKQ